MSEIKDFWNHHHKLQTIRYLSNYSFEQVKNYLDIGKYLRPGIFILDIGVGTGREARDMKKLGYSVWAVDISPLALENVKDVIEEGWLFENIEEITSNIFDLAICQLVAQHNTDENLKKLLKNVIRSLNSVGVLAIQFATHMDKNHIIDESVSCQEAGAVCRTKEHMKRLVEECKGKVTYECKTIKYPEWKTEWNGFHIRRVWNK